MDEPLDELYLHWLYKKIGSVRLKNPARTYWSLARKLYTKEFVWLIPNDDNRAEDGRELRYEFMHDEEISYVDDAWMDLGCSMLEMLIALSRRLAFQTEGDPRSWFWHLLDNLGLEHYTDAYFGVMDYEGELDEKLDSVIWRTYEPDGGGGLFPLRHPHEDQRDVELWFQLSAYLLERE